MVFSPPLGLAPLNYCRLYRYPGRCLFQYDRLGDQGPRYSLFLKSHTGNVFGISPLSITDTCYRQRYLP